MSATNNSTDDTDAQTANNPVDDENEPIIAVGGDGSIEPQPVDWAALWDEFSFGETNAVGFEGVSKTQLRAALECTEQPITGGPQGHIDDAVERGILHEVHATGAGGESPLRGYVLLERGAAA